MSTYSLSHVSDAVLARDLVAAAARDRASTATLLAHIAEFDARKLYLPAAHSSMYSYCVHELRLCEQAAFKRIRAARTARQYPAIFTAIADGRLHLSAVILLAPYLTPENADELLEAAARQNRETIERLLAERFPRPDLPERIEAIPAPQLSPGTVGASGSGGSFNSPRGQLRRLRGNPPQTVPPRSLRRSRHSAMRSRPWSIRRPPTCCVMPRPCSGTSSAPVTLPRFSPPRSGCSCDIWSAGSSLRWTGLAGVVARLRTRATSPPRSSARSGSGIRTSARSGARAASAARRGQGSSSITSSRWRAEVWRRWMACGCDAARTISTTRSARSAPGSWTASDNRRGRPRPLQSASRPPKK